MLQGIGIGPALRKARLLRGKSIQEASRETRIRAEYLQALERERFDALLGEVYIRGFLRSYSTYLGLDANKVLTIYNRHFGGPRTTLPTPHPTPVRTPAGWHPHLPQSFRLHPSWTFLIGVAMLALLVFGAAGFFSRSRSSPLSDEGITSRNGGLAVPGGTVTVSIAATRPVRAKVMVDGTVSFDALIRGGEARSFEGEERIRVDLNHGGDAVITVNGHSLGSPGVPTSAYSAAFTPDDFKGESSNDTPVPGPTASAGVTPSQSSSPGTGTSPSASPGL